MGRGNKKEINMNWKDLLNKNAWQRFLIKTYNTTTDPDEKKTIE